MITTKRKRGDIGEKQAEQFLIRRGYKILEKNYQNRFGEIDIICKRGNDIHFVEVKTSFSVFDAEENMTKNKFRKILKTANLYLFEKDCGNVSIYFDLISVNFYKKKISLYQNVNIDFN